MRKNEQYAFSLNGEDEWILNDEDYALAQIEEDEYIFKKKIETIFVATPKFGTHKDMFNIDSLIEEMQDNAYQECEEAEDYLSEITKEHKLELTKLILNYLKKHARPPNFFEAINIKEITVADFKKQFFNKE